MVYCGLYPADGAKYPDLRDALEKLQLNDASLQYEPETSVRLWALASGAASWGCCIWRSSRSAWSESTIWILLRRRPALSIRYTRRTATVIDLTNPTNLPDPSEIEYMEEPMVSAEIMVTTEFVGAIMDLVPGAPRCLPWYGVYGRDARTAEV